MGKGFQSERYRGAIARLVARRKELRLSQAEVAKRLGTRQQYISKYESGERRLDVIEFLDAAEALELDPFKALVSVIGCKLPE